MKKHITLSFLLMLTAAGLHAQNNQTDEDQVKTVINNLFTGMKNADSALVRSAFADTSILQTIARKKDGSYAVKTEQTDEFIQFIGMAKKDRFDEQIVFTKILIDQNLASVWTDYKFYADKKFSHCGVNSFQLFKGENGWKIIYLIDTRRKDNCNP